MDDNTYDGWVWLTGYELDAEGNAVERREVYVQLAGLLPCQQRNGRLLDPPNEYGDGMAGGVFKTPLIV
ncbi:hypothetical protein [Micromonospora zhanjiangensis]